MAGARPRGNLPVENVFDDEEENSAGKYFKNW